MKFSLISTAMLLVSLLLAPTLLAQSPDSASQSAASPAQSSASAAEVPRLIKFSGTLLDAQDRPLAGPVGVTFALHAQQTGGAALWTETQNVTPDARGNYTVLLGANSTNGVPAELFASGEARWLEVQVERQTEQPRILLVSVPYALKAKDAETLGGRPASAFLTTETLAGAGNSVGTTAAAPSSSAALPSSKAQATPKKAASAPQPAAACSSVTSDGTAALNSIAMFTAACNIESSLMTQALINGFPGVDVAGNNAGLQLRGTGTHEVIVAGASSSGRFGQDSTGPFVASDTNGKSIKFLTNNGALNEWMRITSAGNVGIGTTTPGAKLEIAGGNLALPNTASGGTAGVITLGGAPFLHNFGNRNTFVGTSAGNFSMSTLIAIYNTAVGASTLTNDTTGSGNSAFGTFALQSNTSGFNNSAFGTFALQSNTTGQENAAFGASALLSNTTGDFNSAFGLGALQSNTTGTGNDGFGTFALRDNTTGRFNSAFGDSALQDNATGGSNSAFGVSALSMNTMGNQNAAFGDSALLLNTSGSGNTAFGNSGLINLTSGDSNIAIGPGAGQSLKTGSKNIYIGNTGPVSGTESNTIRIGSGQAAAFMDGISGATSASGTAVLVNASGQLGTLLSSRRFKDEIRRHGR